MGNKYKWHGEPVIATFGSVLTKPNIEKPLWWYNYECAISKNSMALLPAIRVETKSGEVFVIANHFGIGVHKLLNGGWPNYQHFGLDTDKFTEADGQIDRYLFIKSFDEEEFSKHESERDKWQKENYPKEYEAAEALRAAFKKGRT